MAEFGTNTEEDLQVLDAKMKALRLDYEQYFLGSRPRAPSQLRGEVQKMIAFYANVPIQNTALRFKFNNLRARFFSFRRHWDDTLRKIEDGRYDKHRFQAELHDRERGLSASEAEAPRAEAVAPEAELDQVFRAWVEAREATGQGSAGVSREWLARQLEQQAAALRQRFGVAEVRFRVVVEEGRAKLKATPVR
jgi:hypothetical protein